METQQHFHIFSPVVSYKTAGDKVRCVLLSYPSNSATKPGLNWESGTQRETSTVEKTVWIIPKIDKEQNFVYINKLKTNTLRENIPRSYICGLIIPKTKV